MIFSHILESRILNIRADRDGLRWGSGSESGRTGGLGWEERRVGESGCSTLSCLVGLNGVFFLFLEGRMEGHGRLCEGEVEMEMEMESGNYD